MAWAFITHLPGDQETTPSGTSNFGRRHADRRDEEIDGSPRPAAFCAIFQVSRETRRSAKTRTDSDRTTPRRQTNTHGVALRRPPGASAPCSSECVEAPDSPFSVLDAHSDR